MEGIKSAMDQEAVRNQQSACSQNENQKQKQQQKRFTTADTENTENSKTITQQRAEALVKKIGEACDELERLAEENPELVGRVTRGAEEHKDAYVRLKARLELADEAPRCRWVKQDGTACGSPQMKKHIYCFAHRQMMEARALALALPAQEDANAIQIGIMRIQKALIEDTISTKKAGLLLYSMQLALQNVGQTTFGQAKAEGAVRETVDENEALRSQRSAFSKKQRPLTTKDTKGTEKDQNLFTAKPLHGTGSEGAKEKHQGLPPINTDDTDLENGGNDTGMESKFVPMAGGYGFHKVRLKLEPEPGVERSTAQEIAPTDIREIRANLG